MPADGRFAFFATCAPGVEPLLHDEVRELRLAKSERQVGGVYFEGRLSDAWRANLWLRTAVRVLLRIGRFACRDEGELYAAVQGVDWTRHLAPEGRLIVDAQVNESRLDHSRFVEQRVKDAIVDQFRERTGTRPSVDREAADLGVHVHLYRDRATLSLDTSGRALHRRGWRKEQGEAPLAETLAAAVVRRSGWDRRSPLIDPFAGSGTLLVEAGLWAAERAPGLFRERFGFERWPGHDAAAFGREKERAARAAQSGKGPILIGRDRDPRAIDAASRNVEAAGLAGRVQLERGTAASFAPRPGWNAWIVSNLPYGERVGRGEDLERLYRDFGALLRERCRGYHVALLCADDGRRSALGLTGAEETALKNGGLDCVLLCERIPE